MLLIKNALSLTMSMLISLPGLAESKSNLVMASLPQIPWKISQRFTPINRGTLSTTTGGGTRGVCEADSEQKLISLIPKDNIGSTLSGRPTFYWFVSTSQAKTVEFAILDEDKKLFYKTTFALPPTSGIIGFSLPKEAPELKLGQPYRWYMAIACNPGVTEDQLFSEGLVERMTLSSKLAKEIKYAKPEQLSTVYAKHGIWHETLTTLVKRRCTQPTRPTVVDDWQQLLQSVDLENLVDVPLVNICKPKTR